MEYNQIEVILTGALKIVGCYIKNEMSAKLFIIILWDEADH